MIVHAIESFVYSLFVTNCERVQGSPNYSAATGSLDFTAVLQQPINERE